MSQQDVFNILKKVKRGLTAKEVHAKMVKKGSTISKGTVTNNLSKLIKGNGNGVLRYYPNSWNKPKYILKEYATDNIMKQVRRMPYWMI